MGYLAKFGYDEEYFNHLLLQSIENDCLLENEPALKQSLCELMSKGGKRIRPLFLLMATDLGTHLKKEEIYLAAIAIELLHISSLIHDDIIDQSPLRHNVPTLHEQYDAKVALKLGNYLLNKSLELFAHFDNPKLHFQLAQTMKQLCLGEIRQKSDLFNFNLQFEDYLEKSHLKTGTLISTSLVIGGILANLSDDSLTQLDHLGRSIGIVYQLKDDISDFTSLSTTLGKPVGNDLKQGIITLPIIFALEDEVIKEEFLSLESAENSSDLFDSFCKSPTFKHYLQKSEDVCQSYINHALIMMDKLPKLRPKLSHLMELLFN